MPTVTTILFDALSPNEVRTTSLRQLRHSPFVTFCTSLVQCEKPYSRHMQPLEHLIALCTRLSKEI